MTEEDLTSTEGEDVDLVVKFLTGGMTTGERRGEREGLVLIVV